MSENDKNTTQVIVPIEGSLGNGTLVIRAQGGKGRRLRPIEEILFIPTNRSQPTIGAGRIELDFAIGSQTVRYNFSGVVASGKRKQS